MAAPEQKKVDISNIDPQQGARLDAVAARMGAGWDRQKLAELMVADRTGQKVDPEAIKRMNEAVLAAQQQERDPRYLSQTIGRSAEFKVEVYKQEMYFLGIKPAMNGVAPAQPAAAPVQPAPVAAAAPPPKPAEPVSPMAGVVTGQTTLGDGTVGHFKAAPAVEASAPPQKSFQERTGISDPTAYAQLMEQQANWERAGAEGGMRARTSPVEAAIAAERNRQYALANPAPVALAAAAPAVTPTALPPEGPAQPQRSFQERTGISDPAAYAQLMEQQANWERAGTEGGMRARTSPVEAAIAAERNRIAAIQQGVPTGNVTLGDGTQATIKTANLSALESLASGKETGMNSQDTYQRAMAAMAAMAERGVTTAAAPAAIPATAQGPVRSPTMDNQTFAQSLPIDRLAALKDGLAANDPNKLEAMKADMTPAQQRFMDQMKEMMKRDTAGGGINNGLINIALLTGAINALPNNFVAGLTDPSTNLMAMTNHAQVNLGALRQDMAVKAPVPGVTAPGLTA